MSEPPVPPGPPQVPPGVTPPTPPAPPPPPGSPGQPPVAPPPAPPGQPPAAGPPAQPPDAGQPTWQPPQQPPGGATQPFVPPLMPTPKRKGMPRGAKIALAVVGIILVLAIAVVVVAVVVFVNVLSKPADVANDYMKALKNGNMSEAWDLLSPETQSEEGQAGFEEKVGALSGKISKYNTPSIQIRNNLAEVKMNFSLSDGESGTWYIYLVKVEGKWKIGKVTTDRESGFD